MYNNGTIAFKQIKDYGIDTSSLTALKAVGLIYSMPLFCLK